MHQSSRSNGPVDADSALRWRVLLVTLVTLALALLALLRHGSLGDPVAWGLVAATAAGASYLGWLGRGRRAEQSLAAEIDSRRRAEQEVRAADRVKTEILANVSHELRTPIHGMMGMADLLLASGLPPAAHEKVETIDAAAQDLLRLVDDLLDYSRIEAGRLMLHPKDFSLRELLGKVVDLLGPGAVEKGLELRLAVAPELPEELRGDPARLRQVLFNLVGNAVKFTREGYVEVRAESRDAGGGAPRVRFVVRDTGIGIPPEARSLLFAAFTQAESSSSRRFGGAGLGLAICHRIVAWMGGELDFESSRGVGSTFWFELPLTPAEGAVHTASPAVPAPAPADRGSLRVLVVDDDALNRRIALGQLQVLGYQSGFAGSGERALEALTTEAYDAVLMDCQMPELDGYETTRRLRRREAAGSLATGSPASRRRLVVIAVTARAMRGERERCLASGMDDYLAKPFRGSELGRVLDRRLHAETGEPAAAADAEPPASSFRQRIDALRRLGEATGEGVLGPAITAYSTDGARLLGEMRAALAGGDAEALGKAAHGLVSTSGMLGAERLADLLREIEARALESRLDGLDELVEEAEAEIERFGERLSAVEP